MTASVVPVRVLPEDVMLAALCAKPLGTIVFLTVKKTLDENDNIPHGDHFDLGIAPDGTITSDPSGRFFGKKATLASWAKSKSDIIIVIWKGEGRMLNFQEMRVLAEALG